MSNGLIDQIFDTIPCLGCLQVNGKIDLPPGAVLVQLLQLCAEVIVLLLTELEIDSAVGLRSCSNQG
jgi:hypothetical protein